MLVERIDLLSLFMETCMCHVSAGLQRCCVEQSTAPALKMLTIGKETVTWPREGTVGDAASIPNC